MHRPQELVRLHRMGTGCRAAAALLGMSPNTERVYRQALVASSLWDGAVDALPPLDELRRAVEAQRPVACPPRQQCSSIEKYRGLIEPLVRKGAGPQAIHDRIRQEHAEFNGSVSAVKRLCRSIRRARGVRPEDVAIPLETEPGLAAPQPAQHVGRTSATDGVCAIHDLIPTAARITLLSLRFRKNPRSTMASGVCPKRRSPSPFPSAKRRCSAPPRPSYAITIHRACRTIREGEQLASGAASIKQLAPKARARGFYAAR